MTKRLQLSQIKAAIASLDQLVFTYDHEGAIVTRFVTPISVNEDETNVLCAQHLPEEGFRRFKLDKIQQFQRVIARSAIPAEFLEQS